MRLQRPSTPSSRLSVSRINRVSHSGLAFPKFQCGELPLGSWHNIAITLIIRSDRGSRELAINSPSKLGISEGVFGSWNAEKLDR